VIPQSTILSSLNCLAKAPYLKRKRGVCGGKSGDISTSEVNYYLWFKESEKSGQNSENIRKNPIQTNSQMSKSLITKIKRGNCDL